MELTEAYHRQLSDMAIRLGWNARFGFAVRDLTKQAFLDIEYVVHEAAHRVLIGADLHRLSDPGHTDTLIHDAYQTVYGMDRHEIQTAAVTYLVVLEMFRDYEAINPSMVLDHVSDSAKQNTKTQSWTTNVCKERILASTKSRVTQRAAKYILRIAEGT